MTRTNTRNSEIVADVIEDMGQQKCGEEYLTSLIHKVKELEKMWVEASEGNCYSALYTVNYHIYEHLVNDIQIHGPLSVMDSITYDYIKVHTNKA